MFVCWISIVTCFFFKFCSLFWEGAGCLHFPQSRDSLYMASPQPSGMYVGWAYWACHTRSLAPFLMLTTAASQTSFWVSPKAVVWSVPLALGQTPQPVEQRPPHIGLGSDAEHTGFLGQGTDDS